MKHVWDGSKMAEKQVKVLQSSRPAENRYTGFGYYTVYIMQLTFTYNIAALEQKMVRLFKTRKDHPAVIF